MSKRSSLGGGSVPLGGIVMMHEDYPTASFSENGKEYLRCGSVVPYDATKHTDFANLGYGYNRFPAALDYPSMLQTDETEHVYAMGTYGRLVQIDSGDPGSPVYAFASPSTAFATPFLIRYPRVASSSNLAAYLNRSAPTYISGLGVWAFVQETAQSRFTIFTSKDGVNWVSAEFNVGIGSISLSDCAGAGNCLFIRTNASGATAYVYRIELSDDRLDVVRTHTVFNSTGYGPLGSLVTVGPDDVIFTTAVSATPTYRVYGLSSATISQGTVSFQSAIVTAPGYKAIRSPNGTIVLMVGGTTATFYYGTSLATLVLSGTQPGITGNAGVSAYYGGWTGQFFFIATQAGTSPAFTYSTDGNSWTTQSLTGAGMYVHGFKKHLIWTNDATAAGQRIRDMSLNSDTAWSTTVSCPGTARPGSYLTAGGKTLCVVPGIGIASVGANLFDHDLVYSAPLASTTITLNSQLKYVNGRWFVVGTAGGMLIHSADGVTWAAVAVPLTTAVMDVAYIAGKWVIAGTGATYNLAYSSDLVAWTGVTIVAGGNAARQILQFDTTRLVVGVDGTTLRQSTDGVTWNNVAGATAVGANAVGVVDGANGYIFVKGTTQGKCAKWVSTDSGLTWALGTAIDLPNNAPGTSGTSVPYSFIKRGTRWYCLVGSSAGAGAQAASPDLGVFSTTDMTTFSPVRTVMPQQVNPSGYAVKLFEYGGALLCQTAVTNTCAVFEAAGVGFVGTDQPLQEPGRIGYIRVK